MLTISCQFEENLRGQVQALSVLDKELRKRGFKVFHLDNPPEKGIWCMDEVVRKHRVDAVFINMHVPPRYGTTRLYNTITRPLWNSFWLDHPCVVFTAFCDPYKLYEMPYAPNFINAYGNTPSTQRAVVKVWLGETPALGKNPVGLKGYFKPDVR